MNPSIYPSLQEFAYVSSKMALKSGGFGSYTGTMLYIHNMYRNYCTCVIVGEYSWRVRLFREEVGDRGTPTSKNLLFF